MLDAATLRDATSCQDWFAPTIGGGMLPNDPATAPLRRTLDVHPPPAVDTGAYHTSELRYLFTTAGFNRPLNPAQWHLSDQMVRYRARFAHTGNPNGPGG